MLSFAGFGKERERERGRLFLCWRDKSGQCPCKGCHPDPVSTPVALTLRICLQRIISRLCVPWEEVLRYLGSGLTWFSLLNSRILNRNPVRSTRWHVANQGRFQICLQSQASRLGSPRQRRWWECEWGLPSSPSWLGVDLGLGQDSSSSCIASTSIATDSTQGPRRKWF